MNPIWAASNEWMAEFKAAGCPTDFPDAIPRKSFRAEQLSGYVESRVFALGPLDTGYVIALRLGTDRPSGTTIADWNFKPPWPGQLIDWDYEPEDIIPKEHPDEYKHLSKSRLMKVLNDGGKIYRGSPVEGILCGRSNQPVGESSHGLITAKIGLTDAQGNTVSLPVELTIYRLSHASANRLPVARTGQRVFAHPEFGAYGEGGKPEEAQPMGREMLEMAEAVSDARRRIRRALQAGS